MLPISERLVRFILVRFMAPLLILVSVASQADGVARPARIRARRQEPRALIAAHRAERARERGKVRPEANVVAFGGEALAQLRIHAGLDAQPVRLTGMPVLRP